MDFVRRAQPRPYLRKLVRGDVDWFVSGMATLKIVQNERLNSEEAQVFFPQWVIQ